MEAYREPAPLWDFTSAASGFSQMQDIDFMSLLDKQYQLHQAQSDNSAGPAAASNPTVPSTQLGLERRASSSQTPPSDDSPSPDGSHDNYDDPDGPAGKRKVANDAEEGPNSRTRTAPSTTSTTTSGRRKSTGNPAKDEGRLLKRKEQNRAAQRAFRERKEKHVKDLEDKVAQLEAKNEEATNENENLRDLLTRLQSENIMLKQSQFTFSMPRENMPLQFTPTAIPFQQSLPTSPAFEVGSSAKTPNSSNPLDWSSLTTFDPARLNLLDDLQQQPQSTATDSAMNLDFGFGPSGLASNTPFTTLASNPMFMSFASTFDSPSTSDSPVVPTPNHQSQAFNFDMAPLTSWPPAPNGQETMLDDLLQGYLTGSSNNLDFGFNPSPVPMNLTPVGLRASTSSSPSTSSTDPLYTPKDSPQRDYEGAGAHGDCPKTKAELVKRIEDSGPSPFAPSCSTGVRKATDGILGAMVSCEGGTSLPKTTKNENNIEVLSAWRKITSNPMFNKDTDISELCAEFSAKARCDGTKVVLEPSSVDSIIDSLSKKQDSPAQ